MNLFDTFATETELAEEQLADDMRRQWTVDVETIRARGIHADWMGEPVALSADKARLLSYLYERGYLDWGGKGSVSRVASTKAIGLKNPPNAQAVIDDCLDRGLIEAREYRGSVVYQMTTEGEIALDDYFVDCEISGVDAIGRGVYNLDNEADDQED